MGFRDLIGADDAKRVRRGQLHDRSMKFPSYSEALAQTPGASPQAVWANIYNSRSQGSNRSFIDTLQRASPDAFTPDMVEAFRDDPATKTFVDEHHAKTLAERKKGLAAMGYGAASGLTASWDAELLGALGIVDEEKYDARSKELRDQRPVPFYAGEIGSSLAGAGAGALAVRGAARAALSPSAYAGASQGVNGLFQGAKAYPSMAGVGGASGALWGAGEAEWGNKLEGAKALGLFGALAGPGFIAAGRGAKRGFDAYMRRPQATNTMSKKAVKHMTPSMRQLALNEPTALRELYQGHLGEEGMLADVPHTSDLTIAIGSLGGEGSRGVREKLATRNAAGGLRTDNVLDENLGAAEGAEIARKELQAELKNMSTSEYPRMFARNLELFPVDDIAKRFEEVERLVDPHTAGIIRPYTRRFKQLDDGGYEPMSLEQAHNLASGLNDDITAATRTGREKQAAVMIDLRRGIVEDLRKQFPDYAQLQKKHSSVKSELSALDEGMKILSINKTKVPTVDDLLTIFDGKTDAEQANMRLGARAYLNNVRGVSMISDAPKATDRVASELNKTRNRDTLQEMAGPLSYDVIKQLNNENMYRQTKNRFDRPAMTAAMGHVAADAGLGTPTLLPAAAGKMPAGVSGSVSAGVNAANHMYRYFRGVKRGKLEEEMSKILSAQGPERDQYIKEFSEYLARTEKHRKHSARPGAQRETMEQNIKDILRRAQLDDDEVPF